MTLPPGLWLALWWLPASLADLPVHCLREDVAGKWRFFISQPSDMPQDCGHNTPGEVSDVVWQPAVGRQPAAPPLSGVAFDAPPLELELEGPDLAHTAGSNGADELGWWTMVYDQGFEVRLAGRAFFAFSSLERSNRTHFELTTRCDRTAVGWYRQLPDDDSWLADRYGCFYGVQSEGDGGSGGDSGSGGSGGGSGGRSSDSSDNGHSSSSSSSSSSSGSSGGSGGSISGSSSNRSGRSSLLQVGGSSRRPPPAVRSAQWPIDALVRALHDERPEALKYVGLPTQCPPLPGLPTQWDCLLTAS